MLTWTLNDICVADYKCDLCKKFGSSKKISIQKEPDVIMIVLERYNWFDSTKKYLVNNMKTILNQSITFNKITYILNSIIIHYGISPESGHYINYKKINGSWFEIDDMNVKDLDENILIESSSKNGYAYFFTKISNFQECD